MNNTLDKVLQVVPTSESVCWSPSGVIFFYTDLSGQQVGDHLFDCTYIPSPRVKSLGESVSINNSVLIVLECHFTVFGQDW